MELVAAQVGDVGVLRRMLFATSYLPSDVPHYWNIVATFCNQGSSRVSPESAKMLMENMQILNAEAFCTDEELTRELIAMEYGPTKQPLGVLLIPSQTECFSCGGKLLLRADRPSRLSLYTNVLGTVPATHYHKYCHNYRKGCNVVQFYGYHREMDQRLCYDNWMSLPYFLSSQETGFELEMLRFDVELLVGQISYQQKADIYNISNGYDTTKKYCSTTKNVKPMYSQPPHGAQPERQQLDRRRFETAHLKYACLQLASCYPEAMTPEAVAVEADITNTLKAITPHLFHMFEAKYAAHSCTYPGCGNVLVLDGNMKNRRDVCHAKDAGFIQFDGLPGSIKTGCPETPDFKSRYCSQHKSQACDLQSCEEVDDELDVPSGPTLRLHQQKQSAGNPIVEMILAKKTTRKQTYYQVLWVGRPECYATWEPASSLPQDLIANFESGVSVETTVHIAPLYGHISGTITASDKSTSKPPDPKKAKQERLCPKDCEGAFKDVEETQVLSCRTEKDRALRLNHRTAGILAGVWPCGIITLLRELFLAELKSQVYGHIHQFLQSAPSTASNLKYLCYDDACHLRKYSLNPCRRDLTPTTKILSHLTMAVDKMHMAGHVDSWCKNTCDPHLFTDLNQVDTEVCEQVFSWLSRYGKMTQKMSRHTYIFFLLYICELHNNREIEKLKRANFL